MKKLQSRKFWIALLGEITGIITLSWGANVGDQVGTIGGALILIAVTLGYLHAEASIDKERAKNGM